MVKINKMRFKYNYDNSFMNIYLSNFCCLYSREGDIGFSKSGRLYFESPDEFHCVDCWEIIFEND